jgi:polyribonucleotide nucleotidyltransferase
MDGLLHISELAEHRVREVKDEVSEGDEILVKVIEVDGDRVRLSRKALLKEKRQEGEGGEKGGGEGERKAASGHSNRSGRRPFGGGQGRRNQSSRHR